MKSNSGFTLIEVIAVLVLVGILSAMAGIGIVRGVEGYLLAQSNAETTQKAQLALSRITLELTELSDISSTSTDSAVIFSIPSESRKIGLHGATIKWASGNTLLTEGDILRNGVYTTDGFVVTYFDTNGTQQPASYFTDPKQLARIDLRLRLIRPDVSLGYLEFTTSVVPRNTGAKSAPTG